MNVKVNLKNKKSYQKKVSATNQLDAAAEVMKSGKFYGLIPVFSFS